MCVVASGLGLLAMNSVVGASGLDSALRVSHQNDDQTWSKYVCCIVMHCAFLCLCFMWFMQLKCKMVHGGLSALERLACGLQRSARCSIHDHSWVVGSVGSWCHFIGSDRVLSFLDFYVEDWTLFHFLRIIALGLQFDSHHQGYYGVTVYSWNITIMLHVSIYMAGGSLGVIIIHYV